MRLTFRRKLLGLVGVAAVAFGLDFVAGRLIERRVQAQLLTIRQRYVPKLELEPRLEAQLDRLTRSFQDAVSARDVKQLSATKELETGFLKELDAAGDALEPAEVARVRDALAVYCAAADDVSRRLISNETGESMLERMKAMQDDLAALRDVSARATRLDRAQLTDAFVSTARASEAGNSYQLLIGMVCVGAVLLLSMSVSRDLLRAVAALNAGFRRFGSGDFRQPIPVRGSDELAEAAGLANQMALELEHAEALFLDAQAELEKRVVERTAQLSEANAGLVRGERRWRALFDDSPLPMWTLDKTSSRFLSVNDAALSHYGHGRADFARMTLADVEAPRAPGSAPPDAGGTPSRHRKQDGSLITVEVRTHDFEQEGRAVRLMLMNDVTERERLEEQLRQSQKMDAIGRLAGGVAHDFNNLLSVVLSFSDILLADATVAPHHRDDLEEIRKAGQRAAELTRQLLLFSRQQVTQPRVVDLNDVVSSMEKMIRRIIGEDVELTTALGHPPGQVLIDPTHLEQVIMNLVVNARDAMPRGGKLTLETGDVMLDDAFAAQHVGIKPGRHALIAVTDTGVGMDKETQARIFEPFFTTKEKGKGTGLGLATVFGIVQKAQGALWVYSELAKGTTFKVYFPRTEAEKAAPRPASAEASLRGAETILLVEDEDAVRRATMAVLKRSGYHVLEASNAEEALRLAATPSVKIDLILTDVVMPKTSGPELVARIAQARPKTKVLCMSGYADETVVRHGILDAGIAFVQKPVAPQTLLRKLRELLDGTAASVHNDAEG